jgi:Mrr N-terminal domain
MPKLLADGREFAISSDAWDAWKEAAEPFELPDDVLRRVLRMPTNAMAAVKPAAARSSVTRVTEAKTRTTSSSRSSPREATSGRKRSRIPSDLVLPEGEYELPILEALSAAGGRRPTREVVEEVGRVLSDRLTEADREPIQDGGSPRWQNRVQFARLRLVKGGYMKADSPRGVWEISPAGEERLNEGKA